MRSRCKFCGYHFKNNDEQICPECLTAREEDISCGQYTDDLHSHEEFDSRYRRDDSIFSRNDTFKESSESFIDEERREENKSRIAKIEKKINSSSSRTANTFSSFNTGYGNNGYSSANQTGRTYQNQNTNTLGRSGNSYNFNTSNAAPAKKGGCSKTIAVIIIVIVAINLIGTFLPTLFSDISDIFDDDTNDTYTDTDYYDDDGFSDYDSTVKMTDDGKASLTQNYYSGYYYSSYYYDDTEKEQFKVYNNSEFDYNSTDDFHIYRILTSYSLDAENISDHSVDKIYCIGYSADDEMLSRYDIDCDNTTFNVDLATEQLNFSPCLLCDADADYIVITVEFTNGTDNYSLDFTLDTEAAND